MMRSTTRKAPALRLHCSECGIAADAACNCGAPYIPACEFAANAAAEHPEMSNRAIAEKTGVNEKTVRNVRNAGADKSAPQTRTGRDGKQYPAKRKAKLRLVHPAGPIEEPCTDCDTPAEHWHRSLENLAGDAISLRAYWTRQFGEWEKFDVPSRLVTLATQAAEEWAELARQLKKRRAR